MNRQNTEKYKILQLPTIFNEKIPTINPAVPETKIATSVVLSSDSGINR